MLEERKHQGKGNINKNVDKHWEKKKNMKKVTRKKRSMEERKNNVACKRQPDDFFRSGTKTRMSASRIYHLFFTATTTLDSDIAFIPNLHIKRF
uniref:Uncharacterized protein n=1 Tax=Romanomermis culicivorax TaxID=13658 RepID=A0A915HZ64_ROMCU